MSDDRTYIIAQQVAKLETRFDDGEKYREDAQEHHEERFVRIEDKIDKIPSMVALQLKPMNDQLTKINEKIVFSRGAKWMGMAAIGVIAGLVGFGSSMLLFLDRIKKVLQ